LARLALDATGENIIGDPLHIRATKPRGATTRTAALSIGRRHNFTDWMQPEFQSRIVDQIRRTVEKAGRRFATGPEGFAWLAH
jgi:hypothetical protein